MRQRIDRREFLKTLVAAGIGSLARPTAGTPQGAPTAAAGVVPVRPFGRTGASVSILGLGGMFDIPNNQVLLQQALALGVTYWDTAESYEGGRSESGIGKFFDGNPDARKRVFLVTKSGERSPAALSRPLQRSLERMKTDYVDLYFLHGINSPAELTGEMKAWAERAKGEGRIRFFGFSTHGNMEDCLAAAARVGWVDGMMFTYNYRLMHRDRMRAAVDACAAAGIGLTAMKTQGGGSVKTDTDEEIRLAGHFVHRGFTDAQAKLKAVWEDARISSICSQMPSRTLLGTNAAAAMNRTKLAQGDRDALQRHAEVTRTAYCAGCGRLCSAALDRPAPVSEVMRCLMYHHSYGDRDRARAEFRRLGIERLAALDCRRAESLCPQHMPIARLMKEAAELFG